MVGIAASLLVSAGVCLLVVRVGPSWGWVDRPDDPSLKAHVQPAVPLGGVGIFSAVHVGLAVSGRFDWWLFAASLLLVALGLVDDRVGLAPRVRLGVETMAGIVLAVGLSGSVGWGTASIAALLVVVAVNAVNLFDGLDGLAGSVALVTALGAAGLAQVRGADEIPALVLAASLAGFLLFNWHPARLFLGDNGAYTLALFLVAVVAGAAQGDDALLELGLGVGLLGVFLVDLVGTVLRRFMAGRPLFIGDRNHVYDRLHARIESVPAVALLTALAQSVLVGLALAVASSASPGWGFAIVAALGAVSVAALAFGPWLSADDS